MPRQSLQNEALFDGSAAWTSSWRHRNRKGGDYGNEEDNWAQDGNGAQNCPQDSADGSHNCPQDGTCCSQDGTEGGPRCPQERAEGCTRCPEDGTEGGTRYPQGGAKTYVLEGRPRFWVMLATRSAYRFQSRRGLFRCLLKARAFTFAALVDEIESHRSSLEPLSPLLNRPNGIGFWQFIYQCLNEWISLFAGLGIVSVCSINESQNRGVVRFGSSRYQTASFI
jgi:hypothetical protein